MREAAGGGGGGGRGGACALCRRAMQDLAFRV